MPRTYRAFPIVCLAVLTCIGTSRVVEAGRMPTPDEVRQRLREQQVTSQDIEENIEASQEWVERYKQLAQTNPAYQERVADAEAILRLWQAAKPHAAPSADKPQPDNKPSQVEAKNDGETLLGRAKNDTGSYDTNPGLKVSDAAGGKVNCTTYMETALRKSSFKITESLSKQININVPKGTDLVQLLNSNNSRMTGVVGALVDSGQAHY